MEFIAEIADGGGATANDIKEIIEQGITNIFQNILENND